MRTKRIAMFGFGLLLAGCGTQDEPVPAPGELPPLEMRTTPPMPSDFTLSIGSGGGFAGSWSSTIVDADGTVTLASSGFGDDCEKIVGRMGATARAEIWQQLHAVDFFTMKGQPGNMSTGITVTAGGRTTSVTHELDSCPPKFDELIAFVHARVQVADLEAPKAEVRLGVKFVDGPVYGQCRLECTVTNLSSRVLRVPSGASVAAYMDAPFGLDLELRDADGRRYFPDPGAGGPALPIGPDHFVELRPDEWFVRHVSIGSWFTGNRGADTRTLGQSPGRYEARVRWRSESAPGSGDGVGGATWRGQTELVELPFEVR